MFVITLKLKNTTKYKLYFPKLICLVLIQFDYQPRTQYEGCFQSFLLIRPKGSPLRSKGPWLVCLAMLTDDSLVFKAFSVHLFLVLFISFHLMISIWNVPHTFLFHTQVTFRNKLQNKTVSH